MGMGFLASGLVHLVRPSVFEPLIPPELPAATELVYVSGVAELVCAVRPAHRATMGRPGQRGGAAGGVAGQLPDGPRRDRRAPGPGDRLKVAAVWARLPMQLPMMWAAMQGRSVPAGAGDRRS